jgi:glycosyltransferase involved in cell wall biosynthesis
MKIAYINADPDAPVFGRLGCSVHIQEALRAMLQLGIEVHLFSSRLGDESMYDFSALKVHPLPRVINRNDQSPLAMNHIVRGALEREAEDGAFDLVYERFALYNHVGMEFARELQIPSVLEVNSPLLEEHAARGTLADAAAAEDCAMRSFRAAKVITSVSKQLGHIIEQHPSARGRVRVVPNAVNPERFNNVESTRAKNGFVIGYVGALRTTGGFNTLIEAFAGVARESSQARLLIIGDGPSREHLNREIAARSLTDRVDFTGEVSPDEIPGLLASLDVAVAPYPPVSLFYSSPLKLYEYMAAGLPIVASRIGQVEEVIKDGLTGLLVTPGHAPDLTRALCELEKDSMKRSMLGRAAHAAIQDHTWEHQMVAVLSLAGLHPQLQAQ